MKRIFVLVLLGLVGAGAWFYFKKHREEESELVLYGNIDIREVNLGFRVSGRLDKLLFDEGDAVKPGDVIARLDDEPYKNRLANARALAESSRARLRLRETGNRPQEIAQARALVHEREVTHENAERLRKRMDELLSSKGVSVQDRDNAQAAADEAAARLQSARESLALLEAGFREEDVAQARADLQQAEASVAVAELDLKDTVLVAPSAGVILTRANEAGTILAAGTTVFTVSLENPVWARAYIGESNLGKIHSGTRVLLSTDSSPGKSYRGQIGFISPRAEFTPKSVETKDLRTSLVYRLRIVVENPDAALRQGMPVTIRLAGN